MRISDIAQGIDMLFNWGIFSFNTDNFYLKFIIGHTDYQLGMVETAHFLEEYRARGSSVTEQILNLNLNEKIHLVDLLLENYQPENREYRYNFVFDNCATRPCNIAISALSACGEHIDFNKTQLVSLTYRELITQYIGKNTWLMFGIDLIFGASADQTPNEIEEIFLPEILKGKFSDSTIVSEEQEKRDLVSVHNVLVPPTKDEPSPDEQKVSFPFWVLSVLLLARGFYFYKEIKYWGKKYRLFDCILLVCVGMIGIIAFFLTFISVHPLVGNNYNILWLMPLNVVAGVLIWFKPMRKILFFYFLIYALMIIVAWCIYAANIQVINYAFIPLILTMMIVALSWEIRCYLALDRKKLKKIFRKI
jgi:hypothetical protein